MAQNTIYYPMGGSEAEAINCNYELPVGSLIPWVCPYDENRAEVEVTAIPSGYLECNGQQVVVTDYLELYKVIGTKYNLSTDSDTSKFRVPDLRGRVIESRGEDMANKDGTTGTSALGKQFEGGLPNITGQVDMGRAGYTIAPSGAFTSFGNNDRAQRESGSIPSGFKFDASRSSAIYGNSKTVQPKSMVVIYLIKAKADISVNTTDENQDLGWETIVTQRSTSYNTNIALDFGKKFSNYSDFIVYMRYSNSNYPYYCKMDGVVERLYINTNLYASIVKVDDTNIKFTEMEGFTEFWIVGKKKPKVLVTNEISTEIKLEQKHLVPSSTSTYQFKNDFFLTKVDDYYPVFYSNEEWKGDVWECYIVKNNGVNTNTLQVKLSKALGATDKLWVKFIKMTEV